MVNEMQKLQSKKVGHGHWTLETHVKSIEQRQEKKQELTPELHKRKGNQKGNWGLI